MPAVGLEVAELRGSHARISRVSKLNDLGVTTTAYECAEYGVTMRTRSCVIRPCNLYKLTGVTGVQRSKI